MLPEEKKKLKTIDEFEFPRTSAEKDKQLHQQNQKFSKLSDYIIKYENELAQTNLRETFEFQNTPEGVVNHIFYLARNKDFSKFRHMCDPYDGTIFLSFMELMPAELQTEFADDYKDGRILGKKVAIGNEAQIEVVVGTNRLEKINLVKRMDKWYVKDF